LETPIVILEDGDEIDHGGSVLRFTAARAAGAIGGDAARVMAASTRTPRRRSESREAPS